MNVLKNTTKLYLLCWLLTANYLYAQSNGPASQSKSNLIVFAKNGERFWLVLNGIKQNAQPQQNVKVTNLNADVRWKAKVVFENQALGAIDKSLYLKILDSESADNEVTYQIKKRRNGRYVLKGYSMRPITAVPQTTPQVPNQTVVVYHPTPLPSDDISVKIEVKEGGFDFGVKMKTGDSLVPAPVTTTTHTTTTTQTTASSSNTTKRCHFPLSSFEFGKAKKSIENMNYDEGRLRMAKLTAEKSCLSVNQIKTVLGIFNFEETKLTFAKFAYDHTSNKRDYHQLVSAFIYESNKEALIKHIQSKK